MGGIIEIDLSRKQGVTPENNFLGNQSVGFARIIIPKDRDRGDYVLTCFRTGRIDLYDENNGQYLKQCFITNEVLQNIRFPRGEGELGDSVVWVSQPALFSSPLVVGTFPMAGRVNLRSDEELVIHKEWDKGSVDIVGDAKVGSLVISVSGQKFSKIKVVALGDENSSIDLKSNGFVTVEANKTIKGRSYGDLDIQVVNPENSDVTGVVVTKEECSIAAIYSVDENDEEKKNFTKVKVTKDGLESEQYFCEGEDTTKHTVKTTKDGLESNSAIKGDEIIFSQVVTEDEYRTTFKDCLLSLKDKIATLSQGDDTKIEINDGKIALINQGQSLSSILSDIVSTIEGLTVSTSMGPSGTPLPPTIQKTKKLSQDLSNLFNE